MPHHKSAAKRVRTNEKSRKRNVAIRSRLRRSLTAQRSIEGAEAAAAALPKALSEVDLAQRKGVIPARRADRLKSRLARATNRLARPAAAEASAVSPKKGRGTKKDA